jgi:ferredoxin/flavodoxin---NADP+ reductase
MAQLGTSARPLRVAVVGAGPAGLYAAQALLDRPDLVLTVDVLNRFPTPFGLVRDGVAPDHQSIKAVTRVLERTLADPRVRFCGNVTYGVDLHHRDLKRFYDQIVYAVGAQADRRMSIPGEDLPGSFPAISFVGWYNGHPDYRDLPVDLDCERVVVVGNGNVSMDVTRMLARSHEELAGTDIADHALAALGASRVREVVVLGRRGAAQASFTTPEVRELGRLDGVDVAVDPADIEPDAASRAGMEEDRTAKANLRQLQEYAARPPGTAPRRIALRFLASPVEVLGDGRVEAVRVERNQLVVDPNGGLRSRGTGRFEVIEAGLVLRSIGYRTVPIEGVPFDPATSTLNNIAGQVVHPAPARSPRASTSPAGPSAAPPARSATTSPTPPPRSRPCWPTSPASRASPTTTAIPGRWTRSCAAAGSTSSPTRTGRAWTPTSGPPAPPRAAPGSS